MNANTSRITSTSTSTSVAGEAVVAAPAPLWRAAAPAVRAALVPVAAFVVALGGLGAWAASGAAGSPAELEVTGGRMLLPFDGGETAAFFQVRNTGGADDELLRVEVPSAREAMLSRNVERDGAGTMEMLGSMPVPAGGELAMSHRGMDIMVQGPPKARVGDRVPFVLHFRESGAVEAVAEVVRPGS
ncbi:copper chaperone PCu(A)C [Streptomyces varsoviensis]|uniref:copper chaperone PCu(A)C n=1 Tax=Streptomyces varsoviensis TaxID=67373 RepID=UPI0033C2956D